MTIHLLHGIHTSSKSRRLAALAPTVERVSGIKTMYHEYGDIWGIQTRRQNPIIAERLAKLIEPGDVLVGHSNGCAIWLRAIRDFGAPARGLVILNGALKDDIEIPPYLQWVHVYYNDDDGAVPWARRSIHWLTDPLWGDIGCDGYKGTDWRVTVNCDCEHAPGLPGLRGHSKIVDQPEAEKWAECWGQRITDAD